MKRIVCVVLIIAVLTGVMACQPTPEKSAVRSKANDEFDKALVAEPKTVEVETGKAVQEEFKARDSSVTISINATTDAPDGIEKIQVPEVVAYRFNDEFIKKMVTAFFGDMTAYDYPRGYSKKLISDRMKELEYYMSDEHMSNTDYSEEQKAQLIETYKEQYELFRDAYKQASDDLGKEKSKLKMMPFKYYLSDTEYTLYEKEYSDEELEWLRSDEATTFKARAYSDDMFIHEIFIEQTPADFSQKFATAIFTKSKYYYTNYYQCKEIVHISDYGTANTGGQTLPCTISEVNARELADDTLVKMGLSDQFAITSCSKNNNGFGQDYYNITCRRKVGKLTVDSLPQGGTDGEYRPLYEEEKLKMIITDDGVMQFEYSYPLKVQRIVNEGIEIKTFDEVLDIYKQQSAVTYDTIYDITVEDDGNETVLKSDSARVRITNVDLKVMRIAEKNKTLTYLLTPVWNFSGKITYYAKDNTPIHSTETTVMINAVDGSIVDASDCY